MAKAGPMLALVLTACIFMQLSLGSEDDVLHIVPFCTEKNSSNFAGRDIVGLNKFSSDVPELLNGIRYAYTKFHFTVEKGAKLQSTNTNEATLDVFSEDKIDSGSDEMVKVECNPESKLLMNVYRYIFNVIVHCCLIPLPVIGI